MARLNKYQDKKRPNYLIQSSLGGLTSLVHFQRAKLVNINQSRNLKRTE